MEKNLKGQKVQEQRELLREISDYGGPWTARVRLRVSKELHNLAKEIEELAIRDARRSHLTFRVIGEELGLTMGGAHRRWVTMRKKAKNANNS